eukprot:COSAG06_NODE_1774_length_8427_cov_3.046470_5_plen_89_part_01
MRSGSPERGEVDLLHVGQSFTLRDAGAGAEPHLIPCAAYALLRAHEQAGAVAAREVQHAVPLALHAALQGGDSLAVGLRLRLARAALRD